MNDFERILKQALEKQEVADAHRKYLEALPSNTLDEQQHAYKELLACGIETRLVKGAEYIESIGKEHPHYEAAMRKYDKLCDELEELRK
jgi:hypothetical protein